MRTIFTKHLQNREKVLIRRLPLDGKLKTKHAANGHSGTSLWNGISADLK
jgi:hypothetical protein